MQHYQKPKILFKCNSKITINYIAETDSVL
jgi:hypothetical protein